MQFDTEEQRKLIQQLIAASTFPGSVVDQVYKLKVAVDTAKIIGVAPKPSGGKEAKDGSVQ